MKIIVYGTQNEKDCNFVRSLANLTISRLGLDKSKDYEATCLYSNEMKFEGFEIRQVGQSTLLASYDEHRKRIMKWSRNQDAYWEHFDYEIIS